LAGTNLDPGRRLGRRPHRPWIGYGRLLLDPFWDHTLSGTALRGGVAGTGQARRMAPAFRVFRVLRPVRIHRAAIRHLDADRPLHQHGSARHDPHCSSLGAARRCLPGSPLFAPSDSHGATGRRVPTIASVPRALGRTESIAGQQHQRPGWRTAPMPGTTQPRTIRTGPPTWCHRPQQLQRRAAKAGAGYANPQRLHLTGPLCSPAPALSLTLGSAVLPGSA
jgi:hypothetical protein